MRLLRPKEVMVKLAVSRGKVYQMIRDGVIPAVHIGGCLRVPEEYLDMMIREQLIGWERKTANNQETPNASCDDKVESKYMENGS